MALMDWVQPMWDKIKARSPFAQDEMQSNMTHGGHCGYKPNTAKHRPVREQEKQEPADMGFTTPQADMPTGQEWFATAQQPQATGYQTGYQQPQATGYQPMDNGMGSTYVPPRQSFGNTVPFPGGMQAPYQPTQHQPQQPPVDNISYMPGNFVGDDGRAFSHCERVAIVNNLNMCYKVMEYMRNGESVVFVTEQIADEDELQRCLDLLYGAAFAMNYSFTKVSSRSIYLLTPASVLVIPYQAVRQMSSQDSMARWGRSYQEPGHRSMEEERYPAMNQQGGFNQGYGRQAPAYGGYAPQGYVAPQSEYTGYGYSAVNFGR